MSTLLFELPHRGRIKVLGEDRKRLLHAMTTNHIQQLEPGQGCYAFFLSAQGRIQSDVTILAQEDDLLLDLEPAQAKPIFAHLDKYIIADDVTLEDATDQQTTLALEGPGAKAILEKIGAPTPEARYASAAWAGRLVVNTTYTGAAESYHIYLSPLDAPILRETLEDAGAIPARDEQVETERILNGKPRYGVDITDTNLTAETGLTHALHFSKGCYLGQEIVERVRSRGHVNKVLTRIEFEGEAPAGTITSQTTDPATNKTVALAYVRP
jgi:folate-binding protein YgfZ